MSKAFSSLKTAQIKWIQKKDREPKVSFSSFVINNKKNILQYLTHLILDGAFENNLRDAFGLLPIHCQSLPSLGIYFHEDNTNTRILRSLQNFSQLENISISSADLLLFMENLTLPSSLKDLVLYLPDSSWQNASQEEIHSHETMTNFSEKWNHLNNLVSLRILKDCAPGEVSTVLSFVDLILKNMPSLVSFDLMLDNVNDCQGMDPIDLTRIFGALGKLSERLQKISLCFPKSFSLSWPTREEDIAFPKLTVLRIRNNFLSDVATIQNILDSLKKESFVNDEVEVSLQNIKVDSNQTFLEVLQTLQKSPRNVKIELQIQTNLLNFDALGEIVSVFLPKIEKASNVSLTVEISRNDFEKKKRKLWDL